MKFRWLLAPAQPELIRSLAGQLDLSPLLVQCLINRGLALPEQINRFLEPRLAQLADPFLLPDMAAAVERLCRARERKESIVLFGDYDVDGVTSTALLLEVLRALGWIVECYLPHRMDEGYGLSTDGVENCLRQHPATLLLAVDCGSTSGPVIATLQKRGVDVIVLDHHQVSSPAPAAVALVNPHRSSGAGGGSADMEPGAPAAEDVVPFAELCSVGLAFKLAHALVKRGREQGWPRAAEFDVRTLLDLVALGTIADIVPLIGENRILVSAGLERLVSTSRPGLVALKTVAQCASPLGAYEVGFQLAPRLNAAGRLETAGEALRLLLANDATEAGNIARSLDAHNRERQKIERDIAEQALASVQGRFHPDRDYVIVEGQDEWHIGVVGIVAARVLRQFYRPTIIFGGDGAELRGSGRSIAGFDLAAALRECSDLLVRHGGHAMAAGLTIETKNLEPFRKRLNDLARRELKPDSLQAPLRLDAEVQLESINLDCLSQLHELAPMGQGNPEIQFFARRLSLQRPPLRMGAEKQHLKLWVTDGTTTHEAVWWRAGNAALPIGPFDLAFVPQLNEYQGRRAVQLKLLDWRPS
jgi:single-stranded-DNA-specific exonuclease